MPEVADVFRRYGPDYRERFGEGLLPSHRRAMDAKSHHTRLVHLTVGAGLPGPGAQPTAGRATRPLQECANVMWFDLVSTVGPRP